MKRIMRRESRIMHSLMVCLIVLSFTSSVSVFAADASPSSTEATPSADMKAKIQQLQAEIASKAAQLESQVSQKLQNRVYGGLIKAKSDTSLTLATDDGSKIVSLNEFTGYSDQSGKHPLKTSLKNLSTDDFIIALGDIDDNEILTAKKIIKSQAPVKPDLVIIYGQLSTTESPSLVVQSKDSKPTTFKTTSATTYQNKQGKMSPKDLLPGSTVIAVGVRQPDSTLTARSIYFISGPLSVTPAASSSAIPKATTSSGKTTTSTQ